MWTFPPHYDGQPHMMFCSIFDRCGIETKTYRAFEGASHKLYQLKNAVPVQTPRLLRLGGMDEEPRRGTAL